MINNETILKSILEKSYKNSDLPPEKSYEFFLGNCTNFKFKRFESDFYFTKEGELFERVFLIGKKSFKRCISLKKVEILTPFDLHRLPCTFEEGVTLQTLCRFMRKDFEFWNLHVLEDCAPLIERILKARKGKKRFPYEAIDMHWPYGDDIEDAKVWMPPNYRIMEFNVWHNKCYLIGVELFSPSDLCFLPIIIDTRIYYVKTYLKSGLKESKLELLGHNVPTLFQIIFSIFYEIGWCGGKALKKRLNKGKKEACAHIRNWVKEHQSIIDKKFKRKRRRTMRSEDFEKIYGEPTGISERERKKWLSHYYSPCFSRTKKKGGIDVSSVYYKNWNKKYYA